MPKEIFIKKKTERPEPTDFRQLREDALTYVQQLSGNKWTDFNDHDPGVTIMDAFNYALTELDYKLSFPLKDYLSTTNDNLSLNNYGLFLPTQVYPSAPITENDYRKFLFDQIPEITNLWIWPSNQDLPGTIDIIVDLAPSIQTFNKSKVEEKIISLYNSNRNLNEKLGKIYFREKQQLDLVGEIHLDQNCDSNEILAQIYFAGAVYFNSGLKYYNLRKLEEEKDWAELLEGPMLQNGFIDNQSIHPVQTTFYLAELYACLKSIKGIIGIENISVANQEQIYTNEISSKNPLKTFAISFPERKQNIQLLLLKNQNEVPIDFAKVQRHYKKLIIKEYGKQNQNTNLIKSDNLENEHKIHFSNYSSIQNDFPAFYGINEQGIPSFYPDDRKAKARQLKGYLLLYDFILAESAKNIGELNQLLLADSSLPEDKLPDLQNTVSHFHELLKSTENKIQIGLTEKFNIQFKNQLFDLLDALYGEKSSLRFFDDFPSYSSSIERIKQRAKFIHEEYHFIPARARGINQLKNSPEDVPGLKQWFTAILGLDHAIELPVTNIFSQYLLRLLSDDEFYTDMKGLFNIDFVIDRLDDNFSREKIFDVPKLSLPEELSKNDFLEFRQKIYLLQHNIIFESFLRNGIKLDNYKVLCPDTDDYILIYHAMEHEEWIALGKFIEKREADKAANQLKNFLIELNRQSENIYLIEHLLLHTGKDANCYNLEIKNENDRLSFSLLEPISHSQINKLAESLKENCQKKDYFNIKEAGNHEQVILRKINNDNADYSMQEFLTIEEAEKFLENIPNDKLSIQTYYMLGENKRLTPDFMDFNLTAVLPAWSARFHDLKFRKWCEELLEQRRPAHLKLNFLWLNAPEIREFEKLYFAWRNAMETESQIKEKTMALALFINKQLEKKDK